MSLEEPASCTSVTENRIAQYDKHAAEFAEKYERVKFADVHPLILDLPKVGDEALDVGAGSGRDAEGLVHLGLHVTAVEPSYRMRLIGKRLHPTCSISWVDDKLPDLTTLGTRRFALILVSAVWMHLMPSERMPAIKRLGQLLSREGFLAITLRIGPADQNRSILEINPEKVEEMARMSGLELFAAACSRDALQRPSISWVSQVYVHRETG